MRDSERTNWAAIRASRQVLPWSGEKDIDPVDLGGATRVEGIAVTAGTEPCWLTSAPEVSAVSVRSTIISWRRCYKVAVTLLHQV